MKKWKNECVSDQCLKFGKVFKMSINGLMRTLMSYLRTLKLFGTISRYTLSQILRSSHTFNPLYLSKKRITDNFFNFELRVFIYGKNYVLKKLCPYVHFLFENSKVFRRKKNKTCTNFQSLSYKIGIKIEKIWIEIFAFWLIKSKFVFYFKVFEAVKNFLV